MKQIWIPKYGNSSVFELRNSPSPEPKAGEIQISVAASGVNFADLSARAGLYPDAPPLPMVVGYEVSGTVSKVGDGVTEFSVGDRVMSISRFGGYSEILCVPSLYATKIHSGADLIEAGAIPVAYLTAYLMLIRLASVRAGDSVLVHSVGGGVGLAALQLAKSRGATVIGTASAKKHDRLRSEGLDFAIDYYTQDFEKETLGFTEGRGVDIVLDAQGGKSFRKSYRCLAPLGRLFCFGLASANASSRLSAVRTLPRSLAQTPIFHPMQLMNANKGVFGINLGHLWDEPAEIREGIEAIAKLWQEGAINPIVDSTFDFDEVGQAHLQLEKGKNFGKVLLTP